jgi:Xaa-Pro aminopeptidase
MEGMRAIKDPAEVEHVRAAVRVITIEPGIYIPGWGGVRVEMTCW